MDWVKALVYILLSGAWCECVLVNLYGDSGLLSFIKAEQMFVGSLSWLPLTSAQHMCSDATLAKLQSYRGMGQLWYETHVQYARASFESERRCSQLSRKIKHTLSQWLYSVYVRYCAAIKEQHSALRTPSHTSARLFVKRPDTTPSRKHSLQQIFHINRGIVRFPRL